jgi:fatty acid synthase subunit beta, fungi type
MFNIASYLPWLVHDLVFDNKALRAIVEHIALESGELLEIVNLNIVDEQYVCAGHVSIMPLCLESQKHFLTPLFSHSQVRNLHCLTSILDGIAAHQEPAILSLEEFLETADRAASFLGQEIAGVVANSRDLPLSLDLRRGKATIPLLGIDVPFHSKLLRPGVDAFRKFLQERIKTENIRPEKMIGRWIPNVMGQPFSLNPEYVEEAARLTSSPVLAKLSTEVR